MMILEFKIKFKKSYFSVVSFCFFDTENAINRFKSAGSKTFGIKAKKSLSDRCDTGDFCIFLNSFLPRRHKL